MKTIAGIDMGTQSIKVVLYSPEDKKIIAKSQVALDIIAKEDGTREQKTQWYQIALKQCFDELPSADKATIVAIGVSGQQHGFVPLDKEGNALYNVKLWNDTSTKEECEILTNQMGGEKEVIKEIANLMLPGFTAPKIFWLKRNKPELFAKLHYIMLPHDYINYLLTDAYVMENGDASGTALYNGPKKCWSEKICNLIDEKLLGLLPNIIDSNHAMGYVTKEAATLYGIPLGIPVSTGGGDNMMGAIGTGCTRDGFLTASLGTSGTLYGYSDKPLADPENGISGFSSSTGGFLPLLCTMNCTVASEETRALFNLGVKDFDKEAEKSVPGANGVVYIPFFNGERTPNLPAGRASIMGLNAANTNIANIARAALESAIYGLKYGLDSFTTLGFKAKEIRLIGGGSKSKIWQQMTADIFNLPVRLPLSDEAAAMGAALQALWCYEHIQGKNVSISDLCDEHIALKDEVIVPIKENLALYQKGYAEYTKYLNAVSPLYK